MLLIRSSGYIICNYIVLSVGLAVLAAPIILPHTVRGCIVALRFSPMARIEKYVGALLALLHQVLLRYQVYTG
jgi:hypothetical protein